MTPENFDTQTTGCCILCEALAQERDAIRRKLDAWELSREISNLREKTKALSISLLEESEGELEQLRNKLAVAKKCLKKSKERCEWYSDKGTEQERHHFVAVELVHDFMEALDAIRGDK